MLFYFLSVCALAALGRAQTLQVSTTVGTVQARLATDGNYFAFYGIKYGGNTAGNNRFKAPPPPPIYPGVFEAVESSVICAQPSARGLIGVEDCLTLNVFTNNVTTPKPVFVFLNGEEYESSSTIPYTYRKQIEEGLVVVTMNYRLSIFGFLCLGVTEAPGNAGLKDVVQGLEWVRDNIAGFGGNPNNVLLFGHGSAAAMVDLITMSPMATNLVHKAVAQSGSALAPWAVSYDAARKARNFGKSLGYTSKDRSELAQLLVSTDINILVNAISQFEFRNQSILFSPCIEDVNLNPNDTFLHDAPLNILRSGNYSHIPYIAGYTDREGTIRAEEAAFGNWLTLMQNNLTEFLQEDLQYGVNTSLEMTKIREFYFANGQINMQNIEDYLDYFGDVLVLVPVIRGAWERALTSTAPVRLYEFAYLGTMNSDWPYTQIPLTGARHGSVLNFLFNYDLRTTDSQTSDSLVRRFAGFAINGTPQWVVTPSTTWEPVTRGGFNYILYSGSSQVANLSVLTETMRISPHVQRMTMWNDLYSRYYVAPLPVSSSAKLIGFASIVVIAQVVLKLL